MNISFLALIVVVVVVVVLVIVLGSRRSRNSAQVQGQARDQAAVEAQARAIQQWQAAYALANPGQPIPTPPLMLGVDPYGASNRTNTMAILAIIFGFFGGILGIVFGHIALSQIRRTGEGGRGLAITGLVFGYIGVGLTIILLIVDFSVLAQHG